MRKYVRHQFLNLFQTVLRIVKDRNSDDIVCFCGFNYRKSKQRWLSHLHDQHEHYFNQMLNEQRENRAGERILEQQIKLVADDEHDKHDES
ncbi:unnamed protein product [Rotaria socialis]|uniref:Uncharacterized protein n=1 Tax=Rotaria socialis TaxID=392032 RepID=A0A818PDB4_9BILA|nr:unnamed protein product [Rotaria socialis]